MKKNFSILCLMALVFSAGQVFAQAEYRINGINPLALSLDTTGSASCTTITVTLAPGGVINTPLVTAGCWLTWNPAFVTVVDVIPADGAPPSPPTSPWDSGFTSEVPDAGGPGTYFLALGNFGTVALTPEIAICDVDICCAGILGNDPEGIKVTPIPGFDTNVGDTTVWDPEIAAGVVDLTQGHEPPCTCAALEPPAVFLIGGLDTQVAFVPQVFGACLPNNFLFTDDCTQGDVDPVTGLFTAVPILMDEICTVTATDLANTAVTCSSEVLLDFWEGGQGEIALGRECPGEEIDDPAYNRPGRRGLVATCGDIIDFTVCMPYFHELHCLEWTIQPDEHWLTFEQIDDCCWRLSIGDNCDELTKTKAYDITVTETCNNWSDSVVLEIGKLVIDLNDTAVHPESGTANVSVDLINPDHNVRALAFDVVGMGDDNMVCTACTADLDRALQFTCSAAEQADGSCRVVMYATNPAALIAQGDGQVATILYDAIDPAAGDCVMLMPINEQASDQYNEDLCTCGAPGEVCFKTCGDIYPQDCIGGECADEVCGDGVVDLFDILEVIDIILGLQEATLCQIGNADVPNGMPPYCGNPPGDPNCESDGDLDIFDVLVMIDKALGKPNCCDFCNFGKLY